MKDFTSDYTIGKYHFDSLAEAENYIDKTVSEDTGVILKKNGRDFAIYGKTHGGLYKKNIKD